jgi:ribonuclease HI
MDEGIHEKLGRLRESIEATLAELNAIEIALSMGEGFQAMAESQPVKLILWVDGGSRGNPGEGYGSYAIFQEGEDAPIVGDSKVFGQDMTNNESEYMALVWGLEQELGYWATVGGASHIDLTVKTDSALVHGQLEKGWRVNADNLRPLWAKAQKLLGDFLDWRIEKVPRAEVETILGH